MAYGFFYESRGKRYLTKMFGQYIPPDLVSEMAKNPEDYSLQSESRDLTVLFSDVRGFTTISEGLDPKDLSDLMNAYLSPMTKIIHENQGTIDKYMGDAIMAFWGAPISCENHARIALKASMEMMEVLKSINQDFQKKGWPAIDIGIGLNTGHMTVGNMGSSFRMAYTVMGDAVNLGSRLEGLTKEYGVNIIVSEYTKSQVPHFVFRELDRVRVKGKDQPVAIFEPIGEPNSVDKLLSGELSYYEEALNFYRHQDWAKATKAFTELDKAYSRKLYKLYLSRIEHYIEVSPGKDWDGAYTFQTK
jgi:adenylate cyclase